MRKKQQQQQQQNEQSIVPKLELNKLKVYGPIGRGAKGVVFHVKIENSCEDLALKVVLKSTLKTKKKNNGIVNFKKRVLFERQVLREFDHPLLPKLKGVIKTDNIFGYAINYCPGGSLKSLRIKQVDKIFSDDIIRFYGAEIVLALEYLHKNGIVYRDLKPENILIQENGHLMLVDFDLSTKLVPPKLPKTRMTHYSAKKSELTSKKSQLRRLFSLYKSRSESSNSSESNTVGKSNSFVGTAEYVAPEIIQGKGHDFAVDWWSFGVVLHEMLYGTTPFKGSNRKNIFHMILYTSPELVGETTPLRDLIRKVLEKDPKDRISLERIKGHDFFKGVDWDKIVWLSRPPFIPERNEVMEEGIDENVAIDVESVVYGIFNKNDKPKNISDCNKNCGANNYENNCNNNDDNDNNYNSFCYKVDEESTKVRCRLKVWNNSNILFGYEKIKEKEREENSRMINPAF